MLCRPYFTELFRTRSLSRPRLLFLVERDGKWCIFSSPQPQDPYEKLSLVVAADFQFMFRSDIYQHISYDSGLIYLPHVGISKRYGDSMICNPSTGKYLILPELRTSYCYSTSVSFLGFDPIDKEFKLLIMKDVINYEMVHHILTLRTEKVGLRKIQCPLTHVVCSSGICINGVLYYKGYEIDYMVDIIVCFDIRSEKFKFLNLPQDCYYHWTNGLINYKGKLVVIRLKYADDGGFPIELCMWVLEDVEKLEWSTKYVYTLRDEDKVVEVNEDLSVVGMTARGEIVLSTHRTSKPFYVFYFNPKRNTLQSVEIQGFGANNEALETGHRVHAFVDHVEDLNFNVI